MSAACRLFFGRDHLRERVGCTTATKDCERQDEDHDLGTTVQSRRNDVVVFDEELGPLPSEIPLSEETQEEEHADGRVDANEEVAHLPKNDGHVDVTPSWMWEKPVHDPERERHNESDEVGYCDPLVFRTNGKDVTGDTPRNGQRVELLNILSTPDIGSKDS